MDVKRNPENWISLVETKSGVTSLPNEIRFSFHYVKEITWKYRMSSKINSHVFV